MSWLRALIAAIGERLRQAPPSARPAKRERVICLGCDERSEILEKVLGPGAYDVSFITSVDRAYAEIARAMPDKVILCMRADDEERLRVLSMLTLDPRTNAIPVMTCVAHVTGAGHSDLDGAGVSGIVSATHAVVLH
jgi:hypothetical protein